MDVSPKTEVELVSIDLPEAEAAPLLDSGIVPGCFLCRLLTSPSGDPVLSADGICFALRRETARCLRVKPPGECRLQQRDRPTPTDDEVPGSHEA